MADARMAANYQNEVWASRNFPDNVWCAVNSTAIAFLKFEVDSFIRGGAEDVGTVWIVFRQSSGGDYGKSYAYPNVPRKKWYEFLVSGSKGRFHHYILQPQYSIA